MVASWKGIIFKTTNGGDTWGYQLPDTNEIKFKKYFSQTSQTIILVGHIRII
ncbi:MAG: hypothetical protein IPL53_14675 [Ignavibacteria bacterium]|nr:hypothetical protein [Ignavibacteria bacterium]